MRTKFKAWAEPYINEHKEVSISIDDLLNVSNYYLEIGAGKGDFLIKMAKNNPDKLFIGVERNITCSGITAKKLVENEINNAKIMYIDANVLLPQLKDNSVSTIFLNFSDPWPKKKHHKRRLTNISLLKEYYRVLAQGGKLIFKTDNLDLFNDSLEYFKESSFTLVSCSNDYKGEDPFDAVTEYEQYFINEGTLINRVVFIK